MDGTDGRDDGELVAAVLAGQREAFGPLLARWQASVLRLCRRLLGPGHQVEDVAQEAAVAAFLGLPRLADPARFGAWLQAIAANHARMALRRRRMLALDGLPPGAAMGLGGGESGPTPADAAALAEEVLTRAPTRREEHRMDIPALIDIDVAFVGRLALSTDCVVMLRERGGPRRLALEAVDAVTGEAVERLLGDDHRWRRPPTTCSRGWSRRSVAGSSRSPSAGWSARRCMPTSPWSATGSGAR
jgi:DNA-directed RNA polymerase specialized sigma24 family protein